MSDIVIASNQSLKVNRAIGSTTTVNANAYAVINYKVTLAVPNVSMGSVAAGFGGIVQMFFGAGQTIPTTFTSIVGTHSNQDIIGTYTIFNGVEFINSP